MTKPSQKSKPADRAFDIKVEKVGASWVAKGRGKTGHGPGPLSASWDLLRRLADAAKVEPG